MMKLGLNTEGLKLLIERGGVQRWSGLRSVPLLCMPWMLSSACTCLGFSLRRCCTYWHGLAAMEGTDCRLGLSMCGELDEGAAWKREQMYATHTCTQAYPIDILYSKCLKAYRILIKDAELYLTPQKSLCSERLSLHSRLPHSGH